MMKELFFVGCVFFSMNVLAGTSEKEEYGEKDIQDGITGVNVGINVKQTWATARSVPGEGWATDNNGETDRDETKGFAKAKYCQLAPAIGFGYSHTFRNGFFVGGDIELTKENSDKRIAGALIDEAGDGNAEEKKGDVEIENSNYSFALRGKGGFYVKDWKTAIYGIAGVKWSKVTVAFLHEIDMRKTKINAMPVVGIGFERKVGRGFSFSAEYEHFWRRSSSTSTASKPELGNPTLVEIGQVFKNSSHGSSIKVGFKYYPTW